MSDGSHGRAQPVRNAIIPTVAGRSEVRKTSSAANTVVENTRREELLAKVRAALSGGDWRAARAICTELLNCRRCGIVPQR